MGEDVTLFPADWSENTHCALCGRPFATQAEEDRHDDSCDPGHWCEAYCWVDRGAECVFDVLGHTALDLALALRARLAAAEKVVEAAREYLGVLTAADSFECFDPDVVDVDDDVLAEKPCGECAACRFAAALAAASSTDRETDG